MRVSSALTHSCVMKNLPLPAIISRILSRYYVSVAATQTRVWRSLSPLGVKGCASKRVRGLIGNVWSFPVKKIAGCYVRPIRLHYEIVRRRDEEGGRGRRNRWLIRRFKNRARCIAPGFSTPLFALTIRSLQPVILRLALPTISACRCLLVILSRSFAPGPLLRFGSPVTPPFLRLVREIYDRMSWNSDSTSVPFCDKKLPGNCDRSRGWHTESGSCSVTRLPRIAENEQKLQLSKLWDVLCICILLRFVWDISEETRFFLQCKLL